MSRMINNQLGLQKPMTHTYIADYTCLNMYGKISHTLNQHKTNHLYQHHIKSIQGFQVLDTYCIFTTYYDQYRRVYTVTLHCMFDAA